jgi:hypothetical protein
MTSPYHPQNAAAMPGPPPNTDYGKAGATGTELFASTRMVGLFERIRALEERITSLEIQAAQKV